jgi:hypothetical protein
VSSPKLTIYRGAVRDYEYSVSDKIDVRFPVPHHFVIGTDVYLAIHWSHVGTSISGQLTLDIVACYAKGHNQEAFCPPIEITKVIPTPNTSVIPQYCHCVDDIQLSGEGASPTQLDRAAFEPHGMVLASLTVTEIPDISGGHQTTNVLGTKGRTPDFWS